MPWIDSYYGPWRDTEYTCKCGWQGFGRDCPAGDVHEGCFTNICPRCKEELLVFSFPTIEESRANWDKVDPDDKKVVEIVERRQAEFERRKLSRPDQLPEIDAESFELTWDQTEGWDAEVRILHGDRVIHSEPGAWENWERFVEIGKVLERRYGRRLRDLVPTERSLESLIGESPYAEERVGRRRAVLRGEIRTGPPK